MAKRKRKPRVYNWIARGYKDALAGTPFKHAPSKDLENKARDTWTPEEEQYFDGYNSAKADIIDGQVPGKETQLES